MTIGVLTGDGSRKSRKRHAAEANEPRVETGTAGGQAGAESKVKGCVTIDVRIKPEEVAQDMVATAFRAASKREAEGLDPRECPNCHDAHSTPRHD